MARERYLIGVDLNELKPEPPEQKPKMTFGQRVQRFWMNYKWPAIIVTFLVVAVGWLVIQKAAGAKADYTLTIVTQDPMDPMAMADLSGILQRYGKDLNGDGHVIVEVENLAMSNTTDQTALAARYAGSLVGHDRNDTFMFFAYEPSVYANQIANFPNGFRTIDSADPGISADKLYWDWKDDNTVAETVPKDMYFAVRAGNTAASKQVSDECLALLENYINRPKDD